MSQIFINYWQRKKLLGSAKPLFRKSSWIQSDELCEIEKIYFFNLKNAKYILDIGAGDLSFKEKMKKSGIVAEYHTLDIGREHEYTYSNISQINKKYDAIVCLDVIEHLSFNEGIDLIYKMIEILEPNGTLIIQTPNARCIRHPQSWDMTHKHIYNLPDLWALLTTEGFLVDGYRVVFKNNGNLVSSFYSFLGKFIITRLLGCDYADNISIVAKKNGN